MTTRERLPKRRESERRQVKIGGHTVHVTVGFYPDGRIGEIFVDVHKEGAPLRAFMSAFAIATSIGLQHGVPAAAYVESLSDLSGGPGGEVEDLDGVTSARSIPDLVAKLFGAVLKERPPPLPAQIAPSPRVDFVIVEMAAGQAIPVRRDDVRQGERVLWDLGGPSAREALDAYLADARGRVGEEQSRGGIIAAPCETPTTDPPPPIPSPPRRKSTAIAKAKGRGGR